MNFYDTVSKYVEYDTMDKKDKNVHEMEYVREKRRYYEKKIKDEMVIIVYSKDEVANFTKVKEKEQQEQAACVSNNGVSNDACISSEVVNVPNVKVSLNNATLEEFLTLPGIGEAKAKEIINYREEKGEFTDINQLKEVKGIGDALFESIKENITL